MSTALMMGLVLAAGVLGLVFVAYLVKQILRQMMCDVYHLNQTVIFSLSDVHPFLFVVAQTHIHPQT